MSTTKSNRPLFKDMSGSVCGHWRVLSYSGSGYWDCRCKCGRVKRVSGLSLRRGTSASCGCTRLGDMPKVLDNCCNVGKKGCWEWGGRRTKKGYGTLWYNYRNWSAARVSWQQNCGEIPEGLHVLHSCDNPACCRPSHLFLGTNLDNIADKMVKGRHRSPVGEKHGSAKLTGRVVSLMRKSHSRGMSAASLARRFKVSEATVRDVLKGRTWRHVV